MITTQTFPCVVSGRVTQRAKTIMEQEGFNVRDAVEWFVDFRVSEKKRLLVDKSNLGREIKELESELKRKQDEYDLVVNKLEELKK